METQDEYYDLENRLHILQVMAEDQSKPPFDINTAWAEIYLYLGTQVTGDRMPDDIRKDSLSDYQMGLLMELKRWICRQQVKAREERGRVERRKAKAKARARAPKQLGLGL